MAKRSCSFFCINKKTPLENGVRDEVAKLKLLTRIQSVP